MDTKVLVTAPAEIRTRQSAEPSRIQLGLADNKDRAAIARLRHEVYAEELGQYASSPAQTLSDAVDGWNVYLVAKVRGEIAGFISITPPGHTYSIDKYFARESLPCRFDRQLFEIRLLTVVKPHRGGELATLLMYSALRWVEAHSGTRIIAIGRREVVDMYRRSGLKPMGWSVRA